MFLSQGDYMFPFEAGFYWVKHFFIWSFQTGATNPDGIIRFPTRFLNFIVFELFGNIGVSYFYALFSMAIVFVAFYIFARHFLKIERRSIRLIGALFFTFNPIFLGYLAKVGLLVGVAMLPLCFVVLKMAFDKKQFRYFILYILLLNVSLIHPFTFTINLLVSGIYGFYLLRDRGGFIKAQRLKVLGLMAVGLALYAYFILPIGALGSVSRPEALSEEINNAPIDYTTLVDFANARNPLLALSLSRDVFLDFGYYSPAYQPVYLIAAFVFYLVLFGLYIYNEKRLTKNQRGMMVVLLGAFIVLLMLSMATFFDMNRLIKFLINLPGGWMFRSPLKWQLYIPLVLATMLCILLARTNVRRIRTGASAVIVITIALMGLFLSFDIYRLLLKPRQFEQLGALNALDLNQKNMLFINNDDCFAYLQQNLRLVGEFNQVMISHNVQLKRIKSAHAGSVNLGAYDYIFGCNSAVAHPLHNETRFERVNTFADGKLELYQNRAPRPYIYATDTVAALDTTQNLDDKAKFISRTYDRPFDFVKATDALELPVIGLQDPFEAITPSSLHDEKILTKLWPLAAKPHTLHVTQPTPPFFYKVEPDRLTFSHEPADGLMPLSSSALTVESNDKQLEFAYIDPGRTYDNLISNASLEQGLWEKQVKDCYAYDDQPVLEMKLDEREAADGHRSLYLAGQRHIACTGPPSVAVAEGARYLLSFRYKSQGPNAAYRVSFDDPRGVIISDRLPTKGNDWQQFTKEIEVPKDARHIKLLVQAVPSNNNNQGVFYDDFHLTEIPNLQGQLYLTSAKPALERPESVRVEHLDPTQKRVHITGARSGFYLAMRDSYHEQWQARLDAPVGPFKPAPAQFALSADQHIRMNGFMNGWYIDPAELCREQSASCRRQSDGTYDIDLMIEFTPQRWFYTGLLISGVAGTGVAAYFVWLGWRRYKQGAGRYWRA